MTKPDLERSRKASPAQPLDIPAFGADGCRIATPRRLMAFESVLFLTPGDRARAEQAEAPDYFGDLNLDQIVARTALASTDYTLAPYYSFCLDDVDAIRYRQEVFRDLEDPHINAAVRAFTQAMREMRAFLLQSGKLFNTLQRQAQLLDAVVIYLNAVERFAGDLVQAPIESRALAGLRDFVVDHVHGATFRTLGEETNALRLDLANVHYGVHVNGLTVTVRPYELEANYSEHIARTFRKFRQDTQTPSQREVRAALEMNHIEAQILGLVAKLNPDLFARLADYYARHTTFLDRRIGDFDREVQFYLAYNDAIEELKATGLSFAYPRVSSGSKEIAGEDAFDLALAQKLLEAKRPIVCNSFHLQGAERIMVVSGPNQGGKTTFARMIGQLQHLACLGCPVPGRRARMFLCDRTFSHFEREERVATFRGKLEDDLVRVRAIVQRATSRSLIILNEIFTSTTMTDEVLLSRKLMAMLVERDLLAVWVTFVDELASFSAQTVSMVSTTVPDNPALRTFKIARKPADGLAYALALAEKHRVTYAHIKERLAS